MSKYHKACQTVLGTQQAPIITVLTMYLLNGLLDLGMADYCLPAGQIQPPLAFAKFYWNTAMTVRLHIILVYIQHYRATKV